MKHTVANDLSPPLRDLMSVAVESRFRFAGGCDEERCDEDSSRPGGVTSK